ncbi:hypothetical protein [Serratia ficaria]|uniref:hypothetical protein n=1 Tax=Serratia ficaria TaxID=61651 RepID=UPI001F2D66F9|nr:hypothetical protein [Serratia ficaria]
MDFYFLMTGVIQMIFPSRQRIEPGYCVVDTPGSLASQGNMLFRNPRSEAARYFMQINADTPWVKPGQILLVADPNNSQQEASLQQLRLAKGKVNHAMDAVSTDQADFLQRHYATIATILNGSSTGLGIASDAGKQYFTRIDEILKKIEMSYQNQFRTQGTLIGQQFFVERQRLFNELKVLLDKPILSRLARNILNLHPYESIKSALNLSSRSIVHEWSTVGVGAIKGYSTYLDGAGKAVRFMKGAGWIGLAAAGVSTSNDIYHACTSGRENECTRVALKGYGGFFGGAGLGIAGGVAGTAAAGGLCVALGIISAPMAGSAGLACAIVGSTIGGVSGGLLGSSGGEKFGDSMADLLLK